MMPSLRSPRVREPARELECLQLHIALVTQTDKLAVHQVASRRLVNSLDDLKGERITDKNGPSQSTISMILP